jgi:hypothetical protein
MLTRIAVPFIAILSLLLIVTPSFSAERIRITKVGIADHGDQSEDVSVDLHKGVCLTDPQNPTPEPFFDSSVSFTVINGSADLIQIKKFSFIIEAGGFGASRVRSTALSPTSGFFIDSKTTATVTALLFDALSSGQKKVTGARILSSADYGFRNIKFTLQGVTSRGRRITLTARQAVSFDDFDRCKN